MHERVFDEPLVPRTTDLTATEPWVNWFLQSTLPEAIEGRRVINDMYSRFPDKSGCMWERLRGDDEKSRLSALDELLVHDMLARNYRVEYEEGDGTRPDFRLYDRDDAYVGAVEVRTLFLRGDWDALERRQAQLQDDLNARLRLTTHWIQFEVRRWDSNPRFRHMEKWIESALNELRIDPSALPVDRFGRQEKVYLTNAVEIVFRFLPLSPTYVVDENARVVLVGAPISGFINSGARLRERLKEKAGKYDLHGKPFAIVVGVRDPMCDLGQVYEALVGSEEVVVPTVESRRKADDFTVESRRKGDGFFGIWGHRREGKHQQVSAVFSVHEWYPGGWYRPRITRFDNPMAAAPFPDDGLPYSGRWGVTERDETYVRADWLVPPVAPILAREL